MPVLLRRDDWSDEKQYRAVEQIAAELNRVTSLASGLSGSGGGVADGDKGDITVSAAGATWTIDADVVTFAKMQNIATARILGRTTAGSGDIQELTFAAVAALLDHGALSGLGDDDHPQYAAIAQNEEISGKWTFSCDAGAIQFGKAGVANATINLFGDASFQNLDDDKITSFYGDTTNNTGFIFQGIDQGGAGLGGYTNLFGERVVFLTAGSGGIEAEISIVGDSGADGPGVYITQHDTTDYRAGYLGYPLINGGSSRTLQRSDEGRLVTCTGTVTVPPNASVPFSLGMEIVVYNNSGSAITLAQEAGVTIRLDGTATTGDRTLAQRGIGRLIKVGTNEWIACGSAVT